MTRFRARSPKARPWLAGLASGLTSGLLILGFARLSAGLAAGGVDPFASQIGRAHV